MYRNFPYGGCLVKRLVIPNKLELGAEVFSPGAEGYATPQIRGSTMIDAGGYYYFKNPDHQFLFAYGHTAFGFPENYAYIGIYWTWGHDRDGHTISDGRAGLRLERGFGRIGGV